jgi:hypothetical protein
VQLRGGWEQLPDLVWGVIGGMVGGVCFHILNNLFYAGFFIQDKKIRIL